MFLKVLYQEPVTHARAAGTLVDAMYWDNGQERDRAVLEAFIAVFHPEMPRCRVNELINSLLLEQDSE